MLHAVLAAVDSRLDDGGVRNDGLASSEDTLAGPFVTTPATNKARASWQLIPHRRMFIGGDFEEVTKGIREVDGDGLPVVLNVVPTKWFGPPRARGAQKVEEFRSAHSEGKSTESANFSLILCRPPEERDLCVATVVGNHEGASVRRPVAVFLHDVETEDVSVPLGGLFPTRYEDFYVIDLQRCILLPFQKLVGCNREIGTESVLIVGASKARRRRHNQHHR